MSEDASPPVLSCRLGRHAWHAIKTIKTMQFIHVVGTCTCMYMPAGFGWGMEGRGLGINAPAYATCNQTSSAVLLWLPLSCPPEASSLQRINSCSWPAVTCPVKLNGHDHTGTNDDHAGTYELWSVSCFSAG